MDAHGRGILALGITRALRHPLFDFIMEYILFYGPCALWQAVYGLYVAILALSAFCDGVGTWPGIAAILVMSLAGDQILYLLPEMRSWSEFARLFALEFFVACAVFGLFRGRCKLPWKLGDVVGSFAEFVVAVVRARLFHRLTVVPDWSEWAVLPLSLLIMLWADLVVAVVRRAAGLGAPQWHSSEKVLRAVTTTAILVFAISRPSPVSAITGIYPIDYLTVVMMGIILVSG